MERERERERVDAVIFCQAIEGELYFHHNDGRLENQQNTKRDVRLEGMGHLFRSN